MSGLIYALGLPLSGKEIKKRVREERESKSIIEFFHIRMSINKFYLYFKNVRKKR